MRAVHNLFANIFIMLSLQLGTNNLSVSVIAKDGNLKRLVECYKSGKIS